MRCIQCGKYTATEPPDFRCPSCGDLLELVPVGRKPARRSLLRGQVALGVWRYARGLPFARDVKPISLQEGGTPLVPSSGIGKGLGLQELYIKNEGQNPTGSFKDRGMTVAVTKASQRGARTLVCASTGNTSASLAAYAARGGLEAVVIVPSGKVAAGKLVQATVHGARILRVKGNFDEALGLVLEVVRENPALYLMNSINPYRIEGQKTLAYEVFEQLGGRVPDYVVLPVGNAGNISAIWKGFLELKSWRISDRLPRMVGVQAAEAAPIAEAYEKKRDHVKPWGDARTVASAIRIGKPASWKKALRAIRDSGGLSMTVTDREILQAVDELASKEGLFVEAASATPVAALKHLRRTLGPRATIVCVATGNGLKDQESVKVDLERTPELSGGPDLLKALRDSTPG
ncbi:MAG: threonine synthase [Nitrososphaerota archaeon]|nr:threonine synthase [Nitrososphaerota archaeon]MDG6924447.1 threonine synthase [Nitrososphaerota archaeon]MDG6941101.1 threonine synthase [Nitrososphaerota archaeon]MDG6945728.1 threonine synthase [Nitrososphaerota archaeon]MDG6952404.1 threonine synthase [Nitrososphaerota archaeon]